LASSPSAKGIDLQLHLIAVGIGVVHRHRHAVMDAPIGQDALVLELDVVLDQVVDAAVGVGDVVDADRAPRTVMAGVRRHYSQVDQRHAVMLVVVGEKRQYRILVLDLAVEHRLIPSDHLVELTGAIDDMDETGRTDAGHGRSLRGADDGGRTRK